MEIKKRGFTLIEMLISLSVLSIVLVAIISVFLTVLTKSAKIKILQRVENDGHYALRVMERMIRGATDILENSQSLPATCGSGMASIKIKTPGGGITEFACCTAAAGFPTDVCLDDGLDQGYIASASAELGVQRLVSPLVKLDRCQFDCLGGGFEKPDQVIISFSLSQAGTPARVEEQASLDFQTRVTLRNY
jgi:prepilin-type N-terminal cleavage/methylation domain-containing protein